ncbi:transcription factor bHLH125-like protein [Trifolium pratense]|uniref:Uncharacterized protein n=2 Tax=Trifolium pratense TaxID=57577 RepID=A0ACB0IPD5_TRIPR|nr:transcription factor bHLH125-like protein [Trifolium pratense]CAJ2634383.1 unnamed protein product [Trifolium pratense]
MNTHMEVYTNKNNTEMSNRKRGATATKSEETLNTERERRKKMNQMFTHLNTTVPTLLPNATKEAIITETIEYIKELEKKKKMLEDLKELIKIPVIQGSLLIPCRNRNCSVSVTVSNNVAFFGIESVAKPGLITLILKVFFNNQSEILAANVSVNDGILILAITALVQSGNSATIEKIKREIMSL